MYIENDLQRAECFIMERLYSGLQLKGFNDYMQCFSISHVVEGLKAKGYIYGVAYLFDGIIREEGDHITPDGIAYLKTIQPDFREFKERFTGDKKLSEHQIRCEFLKHLHCKEGVPKPTTETVGVTEAECDSTLRRMHEDKLITAQSHWDQETSTCIFTDVCILPKGEEYLQKYHDAN